MGKSLFKAVYFGKYLLLERIGTGGMAEIFRAKVFGAHGFAKEFAVKRILRHLVDDEEFLHMFIDEAKTTVSLCHTNIVQVFDLGEIEGDYFICMEYVHGRDLLDLLARCSEIGLKVPLKLALFILMEMLKGLDFAHKATDAFGVPLGIVHRDVSPSNVLLSYSGHVKIGDFGVAKTRTSRAITHVGTLKGKVGYMSPEQVAGKPSNCRADIFAVGVIFYEILAMNRLFSGASDLETMLKIRDGSAVEDIKKGPELPLQLRNILQRALMRDPELRYQSADDFHQDLLDFAFQNGIQVTIRDLARFMRLVFEDKIESSKLRMSKDPLNQKEAQLLLRGQRVESYRVKVGDEIYSSMDFNELVRFLQNKNSIRDVLVSRNDGPWITIKEVPGLVESVKSTPAIEGQGQLGKKTNHRGLLSATNSGSFTATSFPRIVYRLFASRETGKLLIRMGDISKDIFFIKGHPVFVASNISEELFGDFLVRQKAISENQLIDALGKLEASGRKLGDLLVQEGLIQKQRLNDYLVEHTKDKLLDIFGWTEGRYKFSQTTLPKRKMYVSGLTSPLIISEGVRNAAKMEWMETFFEGDHERIIQRRRNSKLRLVDLRLSSSEMELYYDAINNSLASLMYNKETLSEARELQIYRIIFLLIQVDLLKLGP